MKNKCIYLMREDNVVEIKILNVLKRQNRETNFMIKRRLNGRICVGNKARILPQVSNYLEWKLCTSIF